MGDSVSSFSSTTLSGDLVIMSSKRNSEQPSSISLLTSTISSAPHDFLKFRQSLHAASLAVVKQFLDPLAMSMAAASGKNWRKRKRSKAGNEDGAVVLDKIYLEGFDVDQVWEQVRLLVDQVEGALGEIVRKGAERKKETETEKLTNGNFKKRKLGDGFSEEEKSELGGSGLTSLEEEESEYEVKEVEDMISAEEESDNSNEAAKDEDDEEESDDQEEGGVLIKDVHGLNDGFFDIDEFNKQTELLEQAGYNDDLVDGDEDNEIDYSLEPDQMKHAAKARRKGVKSASDDDDEEEPGEDIFDIDGPLEEENANDIRYEDFFVPPATMQNLSKESKLKKKSNFADFDEEDRDVEADMARVQRDIFDDELSPGEDEEEDADPRNRKSAHERRQAKLTAQIQKLEAQNVAKKKWTLSGEASAKARPLNSLLEEDLEFERIGKPVPVITQEVTESLEEVIKRRILAGEFDEVQKRRPEEISSNFRRGRIEIDDSKPTQSLAEIYEREHLQVVDPLNNPNVKDEKLKKEHDEISALWADVSRKLDSLSSWHYTPKPPKPSISIISDAPAISVEEAQPVVSSGGVNAADVSMLAPQEVYDPYNDKKNAPKPPGTTKEIVGKNNIPISIEEMTTEEKQRRRKRNKERQRKKNAAKGKTHGGISKEGSKKDVVETLKKAGVKIVGKGGERRDVEGKIVREKKRAESGSVFKL